MGYRDDRGNGMNISLPVLGLGLAAGWFLRKLLQQKYEEVSGNGVTSVSDREMIETVFGEYSSQARKSVAEVRREVDARMSNLKTSLQEIDLEKYKELVREVVESVGQNGRLSNEQMLDLQEYLVEDFQHLRSAAETEARKGVRKARRTVKKNQG
jgi:hypothetical protein